MPRKSRPIDRDFERVQRDAWLIVIASEDTHAVKRYFEGFHSSRIQVKVLPTQSGRSSPLDIVNRLDQYRAEYDIGDEDQLWYCGDTDHWVNPGHVRGLADALRRCRASRYQIAISCPCFEYWLYIHFSEHDPNMGTSANHVEDALRSVAGGYCKINGCTSPISIDMIRKAVDRAKKLTPDKPIIPRRHGSSVHKIVLQLFNRGVDDYEIKCVS